MLENYDSGMPLCVLCVFYMYLLPTNSHGSVSSGPTWSWNLCTGEETCALEAPVQLPNAHVSVSIYPLTSSSFISYNIISNKQCVKSDIL